MKDTSIEWADNTINFHMGCTKVSAECTNCYMYRLMPRFGKDPYKVTQMNFDNIRKNLKKWSPSRIFVDSMSDFWHKDIDDDTISEAFGIMQEYSKHTYLILTKRPERMQEYIHQAYLDDHRPPKNIWFGVSCGIKDAIHRISILRNMSVDNIKFISFEPLLEDLGLVNLQGIDWAIIGGESGNNPRPTNFNWIDSLIYQCRSSNVAVFLKQYGGSKKCECHNAWGCRLWNGRTLDEMPSQKQILS